MVKAFTPGATFVIIGMNSSAIASRLVAPIVPSKNAYTSAKIIGLFSLPFKRIAPIKALVPAAKSFFIPIYMAADAFRAAIVIFIFELPISF